MNDALVKEFDEFSNNYTKDMEDLLPFYHKMATAIPSYLPENFSPERILDFGCGNGNSSASLLKSFPNAEFVLLDASGEMLGICKKRFQEKKIKFRKSFFQNINFEPGSFHLIVATISLHHLKMDEKKIIFQRIFKWLKPGGIFYYSDLMIDKAKEPEHSEFLLEWKNFVVKIKNKQEKWDWLMEHYNTFDHTNPVEVQHNWLKRAGFSEISIPWSIGYWVCLLASK